MQILDLDCVFNLKRVHNWNQNSLTGSWSLMSGQLLPTVANTRSLLHPLFSTFFWPAAHFSHFWKRPTVFNFFWHHTFLVFGKKSHCCCWMQPGRSFLRGYQNGESPSLNQKEIRKIKKEIRKKLSRNPNKKLGRNPKKVTGGRPVVEVLAAATVHLSLAWGRATPLPHQRTNVFSYHISFQVWYVFLKSLNMDF